MGTMSEFDSRLSKPVRYFVFAAFVFFGVHFIWQTMHSEMYSLSSVSELQRQFLSVKIPDDARRVTDISVSSKITTQAVYADFVTRMSADQITNFFEKELTSDGWRVIERK
jgi:hypothetical protein